jgi:hypothetical protein
LGVRLLDHVPENISMKQNCGNVHMDDAILLVKEIDRIQIEKRGNVDFVNLVNDAFVRHAINDSKL